MYKKITIIALVLVMLAACSKQEDQNSLSTTKKDNVPTVKTMEATLKPITISIKLGGSVEPKVQTWVYANADGIVQSMNIIEGSRVSANSIVGYISTNEHQSLLASANQAYSTALAAAHGDTANDSVLQAKSRLDTARSLYQARPIISPQFGVVIQKMVENGASVSNKQPILQIADFNQMVVKTAVSEQMIGSLRLGQAVSIKIPILGNKPITGHISLINPIVNIQSRTCTLEINLPGNAQLRPGMTAVCEIAVAHKENALVVPSDAVIVKPNGEKVVYTALADKAVANKVTIGIETNDQSEILTGINLGDLVIIGGQDGLKDGSSIKIAPASNEQNAPESGEGKPKK